MAQPGMRPFVVEGRDEATRAIAAFQRYPKLLGWLVLHAAEVPTLAGLVLTRWDTSSASYIRDFAARFGSRGLLVRSDAASETGRAPRGGYVLSSPDLERDVRRLLDAGRVVFLLEPASPFDDLYSLCLEPAPDWRSWAIEAVGPGFDASDLKRGDVTPHEQLKARLDDDTTAGTRLVAATEVQDAIREIRFQKVAVLLGTAVEDVEQELQRRGETMLLDCRAYRPVSDAMVALAVKYAVRVRPELQRRGLADQHVSISMSFIGREAHPIFWDLVWPHAKYRLGDA